MSLYQNAPSKSLYGVAIECSHKAQQKQLEAQILNLERDQAHNPQSTKAKAASAELLAAETGAEEAQRGRRTVQVEGLGFSVQGLGFLVWALGVWAFKDVLLPSSRCRVVSLL